MYIDKLKLKFLKYGIKSFEKEEILKYLLFYITRKDSNYNSKLANELILRYRSIYNLIKTPNYKYINSNYITEDLFIFLKIINHLIESELLYEDYSKDISLSNSISTYKYLKFNMAHLEREVFKIIYLNTQNNIIYEEILFQGTINQSNIYIREIIKKVIYYNAKSIILAHNHPSGSLEPSISDINITKKIINFLKELDVDVLDHIIVSKNGYYSFLEGGLIH